jgi:phosphopentomutase
VVLDSVGCGGAPDAAAFGDAGANTLGHIAAACAAGRAEDGRSGPLHLPALGALGLGAAMRIADADVLLPSGCPADGGTEDGALWGAAEEVSEGKDTPSGHWELAGVPVPWAWHHFPPGPPSFPPEVVAEIRTIAGVGGILGDRAASGTEILDDLGAEHLKTGWPICYTSADSVFQIDAHEEVFGLERLLQLCRQIAPRLHAMRVGRVIARPFVGEAATGFRRTANRRDYAVPPPGPTLCDAVRAGGGSVHAIGKIGDIFSGQGIDTVRKGSDADLAAHLHAAVAEAPEGSLTFANFVEFDSLYGHRRDVAGYARALEWIDAEIGRATGALRAGDLLLVTADHGNDPTWAGTDHTRERVPVIGRRVGAASPGAIGLCAFSDVGASVAAHLGARLDGPGKALL